MAEEGEPLVLVDAERELREERFFAKAFRDLLSTNEWRGGRHDIFS